VITSNPNLKLTIEFIDPALNPEKREEQAQLLIEELRDMPEVRVSPVPDPSPPEQHKGGGFLAGLIMAQLKVDNAKKLFGFLAERFGNKPLKLTLEINGKKLSLEASSREEFDYLMKAAEDFFAKQ
jgi:hypothetical protein